MVANGFGTRNSSLDSQLKRVVNVCKEYGENSKKIGDLNKSLKAKKKELRMLEAELARRNALGI